MREPVRPIAEEDLPRVARLWGQWAAGQGGTPDPGLWVEMTRGAIEADAYVGFTTGTGFADGLLMTEPATGETLLIGRHIYVDPTHRGEGLSAKLADEVVAESRRRGAVAILVHHKDLAEAWASRFANGMKEVCPVYRGEL